MRPVVEILKAWFVNEWFWVQVFGYTIGTLFVLALMVLGYIFASAWLDAQDKMNKRPREEMLWCGKKNPKNGKLHGFYRKQHAIPLEGTKNGYCPQCFLESLWEAEKIPS